MSTPADIQGASVHRPDAPGATPAAPGPTGQAGAMLPPGHPGMGPGTGMPGQMELRDIHVPGAPALWPPAPGWWLVLVLVLVGLGVLALRLLGLWRARRRRDRIVAELERLRAQPCGPALVGAVSALLKRAALSRFPRAEVAPLTGADWLAFLDRTGGAGGFAGGPGRVLADGAYAPRQECDAEALIVLARRWLRQNL
jgi:hypothetical protein